MEVDLRRLTAGLSIDLELDGAGRPLDPLLVIDLDRADWSNIPAAVGTLDRVLQLVVVVVSTDVLPLDAAPLAERATLVLAPSETMSAVAGRPEDLEEIVTMVGAHPEAALVLNTLLGAHVAGESTVAAIRRESMAYGLLQSGRDFRGWLATRSVRERNTTTGSKVNVSRDRCTLRVTLCDPDRRNAFSRAMRDELFSGLEIAAADPELRVVIDGAGPSFCSGGDLDEFGLSTDPVIGHLVRMTRNVGLLVDSMGDRVSACVHGPVIGAGIEVAAFAGSVVAREDAWFQLPELSYGLIPGAGGTVSVTRRVGRWRAAFMALTGRRIDAATALRWGLVDDVS